MDSHLFRIILVFSHHDAPGAPSNYGAIIANSAHFQFCQTPQGSLLEARAMDPYGPFLDCKGFSIFQLHLERIIPQRSQGSPQKLPSWPPLGLPGPLWVPFRRTTEILAGTRCRIRKACSLEHNAATGQHLNVAPRRGGSVRWPRVDLC